MLDLLSGFVTELRRAGLPVSLTEHLDAAEAVGHIPLEDREALKYALAATLVKSSWHWKAFETTFEIFFARFARVPPTPRRAPASTAGEPTRTTRRTNAPATSGRRNAVSADRGERGREAAPRRA